MINLTKNLKDFSKIMKWDVWFVTPFGLATSLDQAVARCIESDLDPEMCIKPVPVALAEDGSYELVAR